MHTTDPDPAAPSDQPAVEVRLDEIDGRVRDRLRDTEIRYTSTRRTVVHALLRAAGPLTAAALHVESGVRVPLSSLYRTLAVLDEARVLVRSHDTTGVARYELAEWLTGHHHHLSCIECGRTEDIDADSHLDAKLHEIAVAVGQAASFDVSGHHLELRGRCSYCHG